MLIHHSCNVVIIIAYAYASCDGLIHTVVIRKCQSELPTWQDKDSRLQESWYVVARYTHQANAEPKDQNPKWYLFSDDDDEIVNMVQVQDHGRQS